MFDSLSESLGNVFRKLSGRGRLSESNIEEGLQEVRRALLSADVNFKIVKDFIERVKAKALGEEVLKHINPTQMFVGVVHRELQELMGPVDHTIPPAGSRPTVLMMAGLQGAGKTTSTAKLGKYLIKKGRKPMLVAADMIRPAAVEQLKTLGQQNQIPVYFDERQIEDAEHLIDSMTPAERESPEILDGARKHRIARGSGLSIQSLNTMLRNFLELRKIMRSLGKRKRR